MSGWPTEVLIAVRGVHWFPAWAVMQALAMVASFAWLAVSSRREREAPALRLALLAGFGGAAIGARALAALLDLPAKLAAGRASHALESGQTAYGALLGLALVYAFVARRRGLEAGPALDRLAAPMGIMIALARSGCFLAGCDFGRVTSSAWGIRYPAPSPAFRQHLAEGLVLPTDATSLAVHPTQLYEAALGLVVSSVAVAACRRRLRPGAAFAVACVTYAAGRSAIELVRGDLSRGGWAGVSTAQWLGLGVLGAVAVWATRPSCAPTRAALD